MEIKNKISFLVLFIELKSDLLEDGNTAWGDAERKAMKDG